MSSANELKEHNYYVKNLALKNGANEVVVVAVINNKDQTKFSNNKISIVQSWDEVSQNVFLVKDKKVVTTVLKDFSKKTAQETIKKLIRFAKNLPKNNEYYGIGRGPFKYDKIDLTFDKKVVGLGEKAIDYVERGINTALREGAKRTAGVFESQTATIMLTTSNNVEVETEGTWLYFSIRAFTDKDASGHSVCNARMLNQLKIKETVSEATEISKLAKNPIQGREGKYDILFYPLPFANLVSVVGSAASIFSVEAGLSFLQDKLGKKIGSEKFSLFDKPRLTGGYGSIPFDEEGVPTKDKAIIENGVLKTYLHNTSTAKKYKTGNTANAGLLVPAPFNLVVENGNLNKDDLISQIKEGMIITNTWYTRFQNYRTGDFSTIPRDGVFLIEKGKITKSIKGIRISENMLNLLNNVQAIAKERKWVAGWETERVVFCPTVIIKQVKITKATDVKHEHGF